MSNNEKDMLGYDPLAWLKDEEDVVVVEPEDLVEEVAAEGEASPQAEEQAASVAEDINEADEQNEAQTISEPEETPSVPTVDVTTEESGDRFDLGERLHISEVADLHARMLSRLEQGGDIAIDASRVEAADGPSMQLLCAFSQEALKRGNKVDWGNVSDSLIDAAKILGVDKELY